VKFKLIKIGILVQNVIKSIVDMKSKKRKQQRSKSKKNKKKGKIMIQRNNKIERQLERTTKIIKLMINQITKITTVTKTAAITKKINHQAEETMTPEKAKEHQITPKINRNMTALKTVPIPTTITTTTTIMAITIIRAAMVIKIVIEITKTTEITTNIDRRRKTTSRRGKMKDLILLSLQTIDTLLYLLFDYYYINSKMKSEQEWKLVVYDNDYI